MKVLFYVGLFTGERLTPAEILDVAGFLYRYEKVFIVNRTPAENIKEKDYYKNVDTSYLQTSKKFKHLFPQLVIKTLKDRETNEEWTRALKDLINKEYLKEHEIVLHFSSNVKYKFITN